MSIPVRALIATTEAFPASGRQRALPHYLPVATAAPPRLGALALPKRVRAASAKHRQRTISTCLSTIRKRQRAKTFQAPHAWTDRASAFSAHCEFVFWSGLPLHAATNAQ